MNLIGDSLLESHRQECAKLGLHDYRSRCIDSLKLKTVIKVTFVERITNKIAWVI